jgi:hypothetical protein
MFTTRRYLLDGAHDQKAGTGTKANSVDSCTNIKVTELVSNIEYLYSKALDLTTTDYHLLIVPYHNPPKSSYIVAAGRRSAVRLPYSFH